MNYKKLLMSIYKILAFILAQVSTNYKNVVGNARWQAMFEMRMLTLLVFAELMSCRKSIGRNTPAWDVICNVDKSLLNF